MNPVIAIIVATLVLCALTVVLLVELSLLVVAPAWRRVRMALRLSTSPRRPKKNGLRSQTRSYVDVDFKEVVRRS
ncbi:hypothetical protein E4K72_09480 [Oxalobacteraceae bacterium OM1]|nr:hypothetical protein E4K72_09480 [Oxalobacteraceae bacterium OM1]